MPTIYIDDQAYEVPEGENVLEACLSADIDLPYFCWHPAMGSIGACRQCALVQYRDADDTSGRIVMGCMTPVTDGARFSMQGGNAGEFRENIIESLMLNHPHDCPVCAEGGECHLQDMTVMVGHRNRRYRGKKNTHKNQDLGPLIQHEMNRCITCYRCTRFYNDYAGGTDLAAQAAHDHVYFGRQKDGTLESEFAGNLVEVCPTGVFTDKPLVNEYTRKWDLQSAPSVCTGCALGCNIMPGERYGKLKRIHNRYNNDVNGYFLCDRGRYGSAYVNDEQRPRFAGLRQADGRYNAIESNEAVEKLAEWCSQSKSKGKLAGIGSPRASIESNYLLRKLVGDENFASGIADHEALLLGSVVDAMRHSGVHTPSMREVERADAVLILAEDVTNTAPRLALSLRQSVRNLPKQLAAEMRIPEWQDEAVRNIAQDRLSPLFMVGLSDTRLDDIAEQTLSLPPVDIARFGHAVVAELDSTAPSVSGFDEATQNSVKRVAAVLKAAKKPLIVSGTGAQDSAIIEAASQVVQALNNPDAMLSFCLPEANSLGATLLSNDHPVSLTEICQRADAGDIDTLIVLENDLYRRAPRSQIDDLFNKIENLVVLDVLDTTTLSQSSLALPAASFAEAEGTLISSEGRAQRHYPVFLPADQREASWHWLNQALRSTGQAGFEHFDDVVEACAANVEALSKITEASPPDEFRSRGVKVPRQTHRASGRTAMRANISVHEPKQPQDDGSPLAFTMEGDNSKLPGALLPFVWSPGWNSNQSLHKFQSEVGGALAGGTAGVRLIEKEDSSSNTNDLSIPNAFKPVAGQWRLIPLYRIFGSDELSARSPAIEALLTPPFIQLSPADAEQLDAENGDPIAVALPDGDCIMALQISQSIPNGCAGYSVGLPGADWLQPGLSVPLHKTVLEGL